MNGPNRKDMLLMQKYIQLVVIKVPLNFSICYMDVYIRNFVCLFVCLYHINVPVLAHAGHIGTDRSLLMGHNALRLRQIVRDLLHALSHRHDNTWTAFVEPVVNTGGSSSIAHLSETSG